MLQIGNTLVSLDIIEKEFICDLSVCHGSCCVHGDSGAPLEKEELTMLEADYPYIKSYLQAEGRKAIEQQGLSVIDADGDIVTPLIDSKECAFTIFENEIAFCGIERAWEDGLIKFRKPISCHLYPIRIKKYDSFDAVNYDKWEICSAACILGEKHKTAVYEFLKDPLIRKYGEEWYNELEMAAIAYKKIKADTDN